MLVFGVFFCNNLIIKSKAINKKLVFVISIIIKKEQKNDYEDFNKYNIGGCIVIVCVDIYVFLAAQRVFTVLRYNLSPRVAFGDSGANFERFYTLDYFFFNFKILHKFKKTYYFR